MRTQGNFLAVYNAARELYYRPQVRPIDPVVRLADGCVWMLESQLEPGDRKFEIDLEDFNLYWEESYRDNGYQPTAYDIRNFIEVFTPQDDY